MNRHVVLTLMFLCTAMQLPAQDDNSAVRDWNAFFTKRAAQYEVRDKEGNDKLKLRPQPLLTYTNPIRGRDQQGVVFAWMRDSRPEFLATIWSIDVAGQATRRTSHEVHSLAVH